MLQCICKSTTGLMSSSRSAGWEHTTETIIRLEAVAYPTNKNERGYHLHVLPHLNSSLPLRKLSHPPILQLSFSVPAFRHHFVFLPAR